MDTSGKKILIIDDSPQFLDVMRKILEVKGFQVFTAPNGKKAIERVLADVPELVLLDLKLPDFHGEEVLQKIKDINRDIAIIVITGYGGEQVAVDLMRKGAIDFLSKPVDHDVLLTSVENALQIRASQIEDRRFDQYPSLERFFPFLAHEIRNPLHAISGALAIIQRRSNLKDEILSRSIKIINEEVTHLNDFVQECLNFVRPPNTVRFIEVEINEVVSVVMNIISHMLESESKKIKVVTEMDAHLPKIYGNYEEIKQAFVNIVRNGFEAMAEGGQLTIKTCHKSDSPKYVEITFADTGAGIKEENMRNLFNPFFTTKPRGTGLGLAICRRIIAERHHGRINIESQEEKGTVVRIELPLGRRSGDVSGVRS